MNDEDITTCQLAIAMANTGNRDLAYPQFCELYVRNPGDTTLLSWIAYTTPSLEEAYRAISDLERLDPAHPKITYLRNVVRRRQMYGVPVLTCPFCHHVGPVRVAEKVSTGGWVFLIVFLFLFFPICWIGLLMNTPYYACGRCGIALGDRV